MLHALCAGCLSGISGRCHHLMTGKKRTELALPPATRERRPGRGSRAGPSAALGPVQVCHEEQHPSLGEEAWEEQPSNEWCQRCRPLKHPLPSRRLCLGFPGTKPPALGAEHISTLVCWHCLHCTSRPLFWEPYIYCSSSQGVFSYSSK